MAGASGYSFKEWKGVFYPAKIEADAMLPFYAERLPSVEINNTFYRMPRPSMLEHWADITPPGFRFAIKASRRITHIGRLKVDSVADSVGYLYKNLEALGDKRGPVLFQLPPNLRKDVARLAAFLALLPADHRAAFEFRNDTWFDDEVYAALASAGASLCFSEREDDAPPPLVETAPWGYVRLRLEEYSDDDLAKWAQRLRATGWEQIYAYFMHEPTAPAYATSLMKAWNERGGERVIRTARAALEPQVASHAAEMFAVLQDPRIYEFENEPPASEAWLRERFAKLETRRSADRSEHWLNWIVRLATGEPIGYVQATVESGGRAFIAYVLASPWWGRGLAQEAVGAMIDELREAYGATHFVAVFKRRNERSRRLLGRLGFEPAALAEAEDDEDAMQYVPPRAGS